MKGISMMIVYLCSIFLVISAECCKGCDEPLPPRNKITIGTFKIPKGTDVYITMRSVTAPLEFGLAVNRGDTVRFDNEGLLSVIPIEKDFIAWFTFTLMRGDRDHKVEILRDSVYVERNLKDSRGLKIDFQEKAYISLYGTNLSIDIEKILADRKNKK